jgi:fumarylpyruvate hydrolase
MTYKQPQDPGAWLVPPAMTTWLPVADRNGRFAVRRIWCVGRNYAAHAREMGGDDREPPFFFAKPTDAVVASPCEIAYPPQTADLHHEVELVLALGAGGADLSPEAAKQAIFAYGVGLDMTRRDLQNSAKKAGKPWDMAKGFDQSAVCSPLVMAAQVQDAHHGRIWLAVDGEMRQDADLHDMTWNAEEILVHLSKLVTLAPGDLIFTGTPEGVGAVLPGQTMTAGIAGVAELSAKVR